MMFLKIFLFFSSAALAAVDWTLHGADWAEGQCAEREASSPINLDAMDAPLSGAPRFEYGYNLGMGFTLKNDADKVSVEFGDRNVGGVMLGQGETYYPLKRIDFKAHSEHTFRGKTAELEMQLFHEVPDVAPVILSVLIDSTESAPAAEAPPASLLQRFARSKNGKNTNNKRKATFMLLDKILEGELPEPMRDLEREFLQEDGGVALGAFIDGGSFFEYSGAETLPPCRPATWLVRREVQVYPGLAPLVTALQTIVPDGNYRSMMPFNERIVDIVGAKVLPDAYYIPQDRTLLATQWADDALEIAQAAHGFVQDLELRMQNAGKAFAETMLGHREIMDKVQEAEQAAEGVAVEGAAAAPVDPAAAAAVATAPVDPAAAAAVAAAPVDPAAAAAVAAAPVDPAAAAVDPAAAAAATVDPAAAAAADPAAAATV